MTKRRGRFIAVVITLAMVGLFLSLWLNEGPLWRLVMVGKWEHKDKGSRDGVAENECVVDALKKIGEKPTDPIVSRCPGPGSFPRPCSVDKGTSYENSSNFVC